MTAWPAAVAAALAAWSATPVRRASTARVGLRAPLQGVRVLRFGGVAAAVLAAWLLRLPLALLGCAAVAGAVAAMRMAGVRKRRHRAALDADVVTFCFAVAAEVRTGRMPGEAIAAAHAQLGPLAGGMSAVARASAHGATVESELRALAGQTSSSRLDTVAAIWAATGPTGARTADVLERVAVAFTAEDAALADLDALAAGPRATALVLCLLPLVGIGLSTAMGAHPLALLLHTGAGALLLLAAAVLDGCGLLWVRIVTRRALAG